MDEPADNSTEPNSEVDTPATQNPLTDRPTIQDSMIQDNKDLGDGRTKRSLGRVLASRAALVLWVIGFTLVLVPLVARADTHAGPGEFNVQLKPSLSGRTELVVAPLGSLSAKTHDAPVSFRIRLDELNVVDAIGTTTDGGTKDLEDQIRDDLPNALLRVGLIIAAISAGVGVLAALAFPGRRSPARTVIGAIVAPLTIAAITAPAALTYDPDRLISSPEIRGPIAASDTLVAKVTGLDSRYGTVRSRTEVLSSRIADLYSSARTREIAKSEGDVVILHVSDMHLNGVGISLAKDLAKRFKVDAVVDTGDFTSFGFAPESGFVDQLQGFSAPYYLIPGNHDSAEVRRKLKASPYLHYIDGQTFNVGDVTILGIGDPTDTALRIIPRERIRQQYRDQFASTERLVRRTKPDLVLVHNPFQLTPVMGKVPAAAAGHLHLTKLEDVKGTILAVVGSSGATGLGNLLVDRSQPYRFELLRFADSKLVAIDQIELNSDGGEFTLRRRIIDLDDLDVSDELPEADGSEPSKEEIEQRDPGILDAVTSSTAASGSSEEDSTGTASTGSGSSQPEPSQPDATGSTGPATTVPAGDTGTPRGVTTTTP